RTGRTGPSPRRTSPPAGPRVASRLASGDESGLRFAGDRIGIPAAGAQLAGIAIAATEAPIVTMLAVAAIAAHGLVADQIDQSGPAQFLGQAPGGGLVDPHQRGFDHDP